MNVIQRKAIRPSAVDCDVHTLGQSNHLPFARTVSRSDGEGLNNLLSIAIIEWVVQPPFWNEFIWSTEVVC